MRNIQYTRMRIYLLYTSANLSKLLVSIINLVSVRMKLHGQSSVGFFNLLFICTNKNEFKFDPFSKTKTYLPALLGTLRTS